MDNLRRANQVEVRHGIFINRISGAVQPGGLFDQEMIPSGVTFWGEIALENYQVWQLGLLLAALDELDSGFAQLGSSKSRGLGVVRVSLTSILHEQRSGPTPGPRGAGDLMGAAEGARYGLLPEALLPDSPPEPHGLMSRFQARDQESVAAWREAGLRSLQNLPATPAGGR